MVWGIFILMVNIYLHGTATLKPNKQHVNIIINLWRNKMETKQPFQVVGTTVYQLEFDSYRKGVEQMRNRVYANVQGYRDTPKEELEATARLFAAAPDLLKALKNMLEQFNEQTINGMVHDEFMACVNAREAITKAQGEAE
jgi:hypothetical protein